MNYKRGIIIYKIRLVCIGKIKEKYIIDGINEYIKRLKPFCSFEINELKEADVPQNPNSKDIEKALITEEQEIIKACEGFLTVPLCIEGDFYSSEELAKKIIGLGNSGNGNICFIIGSSHGLTEHIKNNGDFKLSFSKMTFPHQLMRLIFTEQLYRVFSIINNTKYHK